MSMQPVSRRRKAIGINWRNPPTGGNARADVLVVK